MEDRMEVVLNTLSSINIEIIIIIKNHYILQRYRL